MADEIKKAKDAAYRFLSYRQRSKKEVIDKLKKRGFPAKIIEEVVKGLIDYNYIDDTKFAVNWAEYRMRKMPVGPSILRYELSKKGISKDIVDNTIKEIYNKYKERSFAIDARNRKARLLKGLPEEKKKHRLYSFLAQKGFSYEIINEVMGEI